MPTTIAFLDGRPVTIADFQAALLEDAGGEVLADYLLEVAVQRRLTERGLHVGPAQIDAERAILLETLNPKPDQAERLLRELRDRRGLGDRRFNQFLARNAGLRLLAQDEVEVSDAAVREAFAQTYGPRYQGRIITVDTLSEASDVVHRARGDAPNAKENFSDLAVARSTDISKVQGGLLSPINALDPNYPASVRSVLAKLRVGEVSGVVSLDRGFAVLKLEQVIPAAKVKFDDVKAELQTTVRRKVERMVMDRLARTMVEQADVVILDAGLDKSWATQKQLLRPPK